MAGAPENNQNARKWNLNEKQKKFCREFIIDFNGTQAAIRAGYSKKTANRIANQLLSKLDIQQYIAHLKFQAVSKYEITTEKIVQEFAKIAFVDITDAYKNWMTLKEFETLKKEKPEICVCISEISTKTDYTREDGQIKGKVEYVRLKFHSKVEALKNLGQYTGMYQKDNEQKQPQIITYQNISKQFPDK